MEPDLLVVDNGYEPIVSGRFQGRVLVHTQGEYRITVDCFTKPRNICLWFGEDFVGSMQTMVDDEGWHTVKLLLIRELHRNKGFGTKFYKTLFACMPAEEKGIKGAISKRRNSVEVPALFSRFNGFISDDGDTLYIPKDGQGGLK